MRFPYGRTPVLTFGVLVVSLLITPVITAYEHVRRNLPNRRSNAPSIR
jgi:hypothetical protein